MHPANSTDVAGRYLPRSHIDLQTETGHNGGPDDSSGNECKLVTSFSGEISDTTTNTSQAESLVRRKFQRTAVDANSNASTTFRKPSLPASATKQQHEPGASFHRRRSTLRENARVPSGPREFPSPGKRTLNGNNSTSSFTPSLNQSTGTRSFLPNIPSEPLFSKSIDPSRFSFGLSSSNNSATSLLNPTNRSSADFDLIPAVNFDDFQTSLASYDGPLLSGFPAIGGRSALPNDLAGGMSKNGEAENTKAGIQRPENTEETGLGRSESFRRRLSAAGPRQLAVAGRPGQLPTQGGGLSVRTRRQSSAAPQPSLTSGVSAPFSEPRPPRKSVGPGLITSLMDNRKTSNPLLHGSEMTTRQAPERVDSLNKASRRLTMQPSSSGVDFQRNPSFAATTQARANKVKSLYAPSHDSEPNTPKSRSAPKPSVSRAHTPSSSGNKRQSTISGRASGLGARTVSPTDTRRLQRLSMMPAPPVPSTSVRPPTTSQDDLPPQLKIDLPDTSRLAQPSPSMIPRKASNPTPSSVRESSPDIRPSTSGAPTLSSKSSTQSLLPSSASASRLPTPKPRHVHSSSAQYIDTEELVPPVPAIPKAYESPRDAEPMPFSSSFKSYGSTTNNEPTLADFDIDGTFVSSSASSKLVRPHTESLQDPDSRSQQPPSTRTHRRTNTFENIERSVTTTGSVQQQRPSYDTTGRKNNNLQPLRLPPLNLMPINTSAANKPAGLPRPSQEIENREDPIAVQTPEPKRTAKTPSTPMTASKATFWRRQDEELAKQKAMRSSSSQYALRDLMQIDDRTSKFFDDAEAENIDSGVTVANLKQRSTITPFASGSLPKTSGEYVRLHGRPSVECGDDPNVNKRTTLQLQTVKPQGPRPSRSGTVSSYKTAETPSSLESPVTEVSQPESKKENGGGIRRRLSMSWRRSSSKAANLMETKSGSRQDGPTNAGAFEKPEPVPKHFNEMPPPKLPASAIWTGDLPSVPRLSLDGARRKSALPPLGKISTGSNASTESISSSLLSKTRSLHSEQPQPISAGNRASSWGTIGTSSRAPSTRSIPNLAKSRHGSTPSTFSAIIKDKDDLAADEEMRRLSQKRKDVDSAARESEQLRQRAVARSPMSPERVLHDPSCALNIFERGEIVDYERDGVYFTGSKSARKIIGSLSSSDSKNSKASNYGYDDERGDYNIVLGDHLAYRYEVVDILGKGSFGQVVRCVDHKDGGVVAVKIIRNKKRFHQQALVEVGILGRLKEWDPDSTHATLSITSSFYFRSHLCIVTPCLSINLYELIRSHNFTGFSLPLIRRFARQLLACLVLLQNKRIIHCDMKPENILLCEARKADIRVIDFGSSCKEEEKVYTYIQSRFYRSPEVILGSTYGLGIDMWSFGCILAELLTGLPIFPGENEQEQLACIMEIFGPPDRHLVDRCTRKKLFFDSVGKPRVTVSSKGRRRRPSSKTLAQALKSDDEAFLDFIARCLRWDPDRRMKPNEAINHPFIMNQAMHQRPAIPEEARRAARVKSNAAVPASASTTAPSPVKRVQTTAGITSNPGSGPLPQASLQTPSARERARPLPDTPQTVVRAAPPASVGPMQSSPLKQLGVNRRHSSVATAGAAAMAGSKRASNGLVVGSNQANPHGPGAGIRHGSSGTLSNASLAQMAARESMGATAAANAARWKAG